MPIDKLFGGVVGVYYPAVRDLVGCQSKRPLKMFLNVVEHLRPRVGNEDVKVSCVLGGPRIGINTSTAHELSREVLVRLSCHW